MVVNCKLLKDYMGYKAGMEIPLLESYYNRLEKEGVVERTSKSLDYWYVKPNKSEEYEEE
jgi:hypothetical protein